MVWCSRELQTGWWSWVDQQWARSTTKMRNLLQVKWLLPNYLQVWTTYKIPPQGNLISTLATGRAGIWEDGGQKLRICSALCLMENNKQNLRFENNLEENQACKQGRDWCAPQARPLLPPESPQRASGNCILHRRTNSVIPGEPGVAWDTWQKLNQ